MTKTNDSKIQKGYIKIDFDLTNVFEKAVYEFFYKMYHGYKKKFIVACAKKYMNCTSDQIKTMLDKMEFDNKSSLNLEGNLESKNQSLNEDKNREHEDRTDSIENNFEHGLNQKQNSKLFKKI